MTQAAKYNVGGLEANVLQRMSGPAERGVPIPGAARVEAALGAATSPGGSKIVYERSFLITMRNSPLARTPPR